MTTITQLHRYKSYTSVTAATTDLLDRGVSFRAEALPGDCWNLIVEKGVVVRPDTTPREPYTIDELETLKQELLSLYHATPSTETRWVLCDNKIQADDDTGIFASDDDALAFVAGVAGISNEPNAILTLAIHTLTNIIERHLATPEEVAELAGDNDVSQDEDGGVERAIGQGFKFNPNPEMQSLK